MLLCPFPLRTATTNSCGLIAFLAIVADRASANFSFPYSFANLPRNDLACVSFIPPVATISLTPICQI